MPSRTIRLSKIEEDRLVRLAEEEGKTPSEVMRECLNFRYQQRGLTNKIGQIEEFLRKLMAAVIVATEKSRERTEVNDEIHKNITYTRIALEYLIPEIAKDVVPSIAEKFDKFKEHKRVKAATTAALDNE